MTFCFSFVRVMVFVDTFLLAAVETLAELVLMDREAVWVAAGFTDTTKGFT